VTVPAETRDVTDGFSCALTPSLSPLPLPTTQVPDSRYPNDLTKQIKLDDGEHCVYCFGSLNYAKIKPGPYPDLRQSSHSIQSICDLIVALQWILTPVPMPIETLGNVKIDCSRALKMSSTCNHNLQA